jgi:hypothetical protein
VGFGSRRKSRRKEMPEGVRIGAPAVDYARAPVVDYVRAPAVDYAWAPVVDCV